MYASQPNEDHVSSLFFGQSLSSKKNYIYFFIYLQSTDTGNGESIHQINYSVNYVNGIVLGQR